MKITILGSGKEVGRSGFLVTSEKEQYFVRLWRDVKEGTIFSNSC